MSNTSPSDTSARGAMPLKPSKRKRAAPESENQDKASVQALDTSHSVLGGLKGGYRRTGSTPENSNPANASSFPKKNLTSFSIPFGDKSIVCERHGRDVGSPVSLIFTHGAGGGISNPATVQFCQGFSKRSPILCFQGTMNLQSRIKTFHATLDYLVEQYGKRSDFVLGGRSMGARAAVQTALDRADEVKALILVSYPLVSAGKKGETRDDLLYELSSDLSVLFISGSRDHMCDLEHLDQVRNKMRAKTCLVKVDGADHGMSLKPKEAVAAMREKSGVVASDWLKDGAMSAGQLDIHWNGSGGVESSGWSLTAGGMSQNADATSSHKAKRRKVKIKG